MLDPLHKEEFRLGHLALAEVQTFDCGDGPWGKEGALWLKASPSPGADCAAVWIEHGTKVWLYRNGQGSLVGYGSLGTTNWRLPTERDPRQRIALIPWVAIQATFWGQPSDVPPTDRYSSQILDDLIYEAAQIFWSAKCGKYLGLLVQPSNSAAIKVYERAEFVTLPTQYVDKSTGVAYNRMILELPAPPSAAVQGND